MKTILFNLILLAITFSANPLFGQKVSLDKKSGIVSVDGSEQFQIERKGKKDFYFVISDLEGNSLMRLNYKYLESDYTGGWFELVLTEQKEKVIVNPSLGASKKMTARYVADHNLIQDGKVNLEAFEEIKLNETYNPPRAVIID